MILEHIFLNEISSLVDPICKIGANDRPNFNKNCSKDPNQVSAFLPCLETLYKQNVQKILPCLVTLTQSELVSNGLLRRIGRQSQKVET